MPSIAETFTVCGVTVGVGMDVASDVAVNGITVGVSVAMGACVAGGAGGVLVL